MYVLSKYIKNINFYPTKFFIFTSLKMCVYCMGMFSCFSDCPEFGTTFQTVSNHLFSAGPDPNVMLTSHTDIDLDDCKVKCLEAVKFDGRECKSASYNENHRECTTFSVSASTMPENLFEEWWVTYLHRDCVCPEDNALCSGKPKLNILNCFINSKMLLHVLAIFSWESLRRQFTIIKDRCT